MIVLHPHQKGEPLKFQEEVSDQVGTISSKDMLLLVESGYCEWQRLARMRKKCTLIILAEYTQLN